VNFTQINFSDIDNAATQLMEANTRILSNLALLEQTTPNITESVIQILANLADTVERGINFSIMHADSVSAFLAGVDTLANALPNTTDAVRRQNTLRVLSSIGIKGGLVTTSATPIAVLGSQREAAYTRYGALVKEYGASVRVGQPYSTKLLPAIKYLQLSIDRAMNAASHHESIQA